MKIIVSGGGTGGHLSVASAFIEEFHKRGWECLFVGSQNGQDKMYFEKDSRIKEKIFLQTCGVVNQKGLHKFQSLFAHFKALKEVIKILQAQKPDFVFSVGGYSAAPMAFGAVLTHTPLFIHEQNAKIGRLNRALKGFAKIFFSSYEAKSPCKFYPTKQEFFNKARVRSEIKNILFMGGSQGARAINHYALSLAEELHTRGFKIFHQCGQKELESLQEQYRNLPLKLRVFEEMCKEDLKTQDFDVGLFGFSKVMPDVMQLCDMAVCRAGASSLWELCANGIPALFVPYPYAAGNHQYFNAKFLEEKQLGFLCEEKELYDETLWSVLEVLQEENNLRKISQALQEECSSSAVYQMVELMLESLR